MTLTQARAAFARYKGKKLTPLRMRVLTHAATVIRSARRGRNPGAIRFRDLAIGETFEFDHSQFRAKGFSCLQFAHGPWKKTGARTYSDARGGAARHQLRPSINAAVLRGSDCGGRGLANPRKRVLVKARRMAAARKGWASRRRAGLRNPIPSAHGERLQGRVIYGRLLRIEAQKTQAHRCDPGCARKGHCYYHDFKSSAEAVIYGLPDGSLRIISRTGKRLWSLF